MGTIPGQRWWTVEFSEAGTVIDPGAVPGAAGLNGLTDVFVFAQSARSPA
jgi:hypothetical protein